MENKLTYQTINICHYDAIITAKFYHENPEAIIVRNYQNGAIIEYLADQTNKIVHLLYICSSESGKKYGTDSLKEFINEFNQYDIITDAVPWLRTWYESFGFVYKYFIEDMCLLKMILSRKGNF